MARSGITREQVAQKRKLIAAREYFQQELRKPAPRIKNEWYPYLVAFELTKDMSRWFSVHSKVVHSPESSFDKNELSRDKVEYRESTTTRPSVWSGGGSFGGGGAVGDWAATAATLARVIPAPSRSSDSWGGSSSNESSSSSNSSSSSSSGGGGGGGW